MKSPLPSFRKILLASLCFSLVIATSAPKADAQQVVQGCQIFPANSIYNKDISGLSVHPNSAIYVNSIGSASATNRFHPDWGTNPAYGIPINIVTGPANPAPVIEFQYADESDVGPYPVNKKTSQIEGYKWGKGKNKGDRHVLMLDVTNHVLYELYSVYPKGKKFRAGSGAIYNLNSNALRPAGWTSADAAGLPIFPFLVNYDEVLTGEIKHALRFTCPQTDNAYIWPARHEAGNNPAFPPMGARFRLKSGFNISGFSQKNQVILTALKKYGMFVADNGSSWYVQGISDPRWSDDELNQLKTITGDNFEMVDESSLMVDPDSGQSN